MNNLPDLSRKSFARTNPQTIAQRVAWLRDLLPGLRSIAEICCGDCSAQAEAYRQYLDLAVYRGLDLKPEIVAANRARGIDCLCGDALDPTVMRQFLDAEVIFFGPPLSVECDGHRLLAFQEVVPGYADFIQLLLVLSPERWAEVLLPGPTRFIGAGQLQAARSVSGRANGKGADI